ncbi:beta-lactamase family protein [Pendulispora rubella]|uniref:Beta-lactamase family protein n=1 Tax=Pendulispora rubella TaxID=2741070 RepID=A0ABZ2LFL9_9BACT
MRKHFFLASLLVVFGVGTGCSQSMPGQAATPLGHWEPSKLAADRRAKFEQLVPKLDKLFSDEQRGSHVPGMGVGLVVGGEVVYAKGFGLRDVERQLPFEADTPFPIASVTKSFTAMTVLRLRDEGKLDLDVPAERYYPPLGRIARATRDSPAVTLRMLLSHGSGMPEDNPWGDVTEHLSEQDLARILDGATMSRASGTAFEYSNLAWGVIGRIVERVSGMPLREAIRRTVFEPLGMTRTDWSPSAFAKGTVAVGYRGHDGNEDMLASREIAPPAELGVLDAAGSIHTTVRDLLRYASFHVSAWPARDEAERGPLRRSSVREMQQGIRALGQNEYVHALTLRSPPAMARFQDGHLRVDSPAYGFGLFSHRTCEEDVQVDHTGGLPGYITVLTMVPQKGFALVVFLNDERAAVRLAARTLRMLREADLLTAPRIDPVPEMAAAPATVGELMSNWNDARARGLFEPTFFRYQSLDAFRERISRLAREHGTCRLDGEPQFVNRMRGRWHVACERGSITFAAGLGPGPKPHLQALELREDFPPSPALRRAGEASVELLAHWDDNTAAALFAKDAELPRIKKTFAQLSLAHGRCGLERAVESDGTSRATFALTCADAPMEWTVSLDAAGRATDAAGRSPRSEAAPNCAE